MSNIHYSHCPLCRSAEILPLFHAVDHTVSHHSFAIWECQDCSGRFTQDAPSMETIDHFYQSEGYISHSDTQKGLINRLYHQIRKLTLLQKKSWVKKATGLSSGSLLDIGCGTGAFLHVMQKSGWETTGLEPNAGAREKAWELYELQVQTTDVLFQLPAQQFDVITLWHVLEHIHPLHEYLEQIRLLLKPNGAVLIAVPNYQSTDARHYHAHWAAYDVPRHLYHFSPASMHKLLSQHQLVCTCHHPMLFDGFYVSLLSEQYHHGQGRLLAGGWHGLQTAVAALLNPLSCSSVVYVVEKTTGPAAVLPV